MKQLSPVLIFLSGVLWGSMGIFVRRYHTMQMSSMDIVAIRAWTTTLFMILFLTLFQRSKLIIKMKDLWCFLGTGLLSILFFNYCYFTAITLTSLSVAAVLLYTAPVFVMLLSKIFFHEKITAVKIIALLATFAGCIFVTGFVGNGAILSIVGIMLGLGAGLGYALYSIFSKFALERGYHTYTIIFYTFLIASVGVIPFTNLRSITTSLSEQPKLIGFSLIFGLISTVLPYVLYTIGLKTVENGKASIIASIEPVVATLLGIFLYNESISLGNTIGIVLVLSAILLCNIKKEKTVENRTLV